MRAAPEGKNKEGKKRQHQPVSRLISHRTSGHQPPGPPGQARRPCRPGCCQVWSGAGPGPGLGPPGPPRLPMIIIGPRDRGPHRVSSR